MYNNLKYKLLKKTFISLLFFGCLNSVQAQTQPETQPQNQTDSLLQTLLVEEKIDTQLVAPTKMLFTQ